MSEIKRTPKQDGKCLLDVMEKRGLVEFGAEISAELVRDTIGLVVPELGTKSQFDALALRELAAIDYVRNILLGRGMYLTFSFGTYRILLPSENMTQVESYISSADKKLSRALKLSRNSPKEVDMASRNHQTSARIMMKRESIREHRNRIN